MPTNLPPEYFEIERLYRGAKTPAEKIAYLERLLSVIPKHKGTDRLRGDLRRRLSKLKSAAQTRKGGGRRGSAFHIEREGAAQVAVIGHANAGKSALVAMLTNATPEVSDIPFTTWKPSPGMMQVDKVQIQLVDTPSLNRDYIEPELMDMIRRADLLLLVVDLLADPMRQLEEAVGFLRKYGIVPGHLKAGYQDGRDLTFKPLMVLANKNDDEETDENFDIFCELVEGDWPVISISVRTGRNLEQLKQEIFQRLEVIRIYSKAPGREPDFSSPFIMKKGSTVEEFAGKIHQDFYEKLKTARVWGSSAFDGQLVGRDYVLHDGDVVELRI